MKSREDISLRSALGLIAIILIMLFIQVPAHGATNCATVINSVTYPDTDCDGITDAEEAAEAAIPECGTGQMNPQPTCSPNGKDLFVMLLPCGDLLNNPTCPGVSKLPATAPLGILSTAAIDLGITVHQIDPSQTCCNTHTVYPACCDLSSNCNNIPACTSDIRNVTPKQMAVRILESTNINGTNLGLTLPPGTPNTAGDATVFTQRIINFVHGLCKCADPNNCPTCQDALGGTQGEANIIAKFIRFAIAHEAGHAMTLRAVSSTDIGEHYPSGTNVLLDSSVYYTQSTSKGVTTTKFYIGSNYYTCTSRCKYAPNDTVSAALR